MHYNSQQAFTAAFQQTGTNYIFGEISFVTDAVGTVLQIALAIDYAIILFHRFMEEIEKYFDITNTMALVIPKGDYIKEAKL